MEIEFNDNNSLNAHVKEGEKCFMCANTTEYNLDDNCGVSIGDIETMKDFGWSDEEDVAALEALEIGERYNCTDWYGGKSAFVIRLG